MDNLYTKKMNELREMASNLGLGGVKGESKEGLIARITIAMHPQILDELNKNGTEQGRAPKLAKDGPVWLTVEEVLEALEPLKGRLKIAFYDEDGQPTTTNAKTWHVKNGPAEDSGSMSVSMKWLKIKAGEIANARFPAVIQGEFEATKTPVLA